jgi:hypothetical protein
MCQEQIKGNVPGTQKGKCSRNKKREMFLEQKKGNVPGTQKGKCARNTKREMCQEQIKENVPGTNKKAHYCVKKFSVK